MSAVISGDLIDGALVSRHEALMREFADGVRSMCVAMWHIREEETYRSCGFESFTAFLRSLGMGAATGRLHANAGPIIEELKKSGHDEFVGHVDVLRPVALLTNSKQTPEVRKRVVLRQAQIVRQAILEARRGQEPFGEKVVSRVAERYGIRPRKEYQAERRRKREAERAKNEMVDGASARARMREDLELAFATIVSYRRSGWELVQEIGAAQQWVGFEDALQIMLDARDA